MLFPRPQAQTYQSQAAPARRQKPRNPPVPVGVELPAADGTRPQTETAELSRARRRKTYQPQAATRTAIDGERGKRVSPS